MKLTRPTPVLMWIVLEIFLQPLIVTSAVTSYEKLRKLADKDDDILIQGIEDVINCNAGQENTKTLTTILAQYSKTPKQDYQFQGDHPNAFYLLVKHYAKTLYNSGIDEDLLPVLEGVIRSHNISFPVSDDFSDAVSALVRLQYVYRLRTRDMFEGDYLGYMGPSLESEDAYVGMALLWYNYPPHMAERDIAHAGCPVLVGNKWTANKWIWINGNTFRRPCGPTPQSQQLDVENVVSLDALKQIIP